ncbi:MULTISPECIES: 2-dehydropantoate 2-reductase [unclassified Rhizobium]|uniref:2-dehydropantoate 2-reductase n=1 Tax=unclassified Rhizobium TaxID=2613769 RepID=UPI001ADBF811|nr:MULTISPECIES: 2-dehydropantoate 2-reductase [unclassified Rhizobium]MBO9101093.1 2-dehydropantoate 2-reductase [Rhizobium sp. L58/93]QXZ87440.1 2-dehydropantoate 2-reductase [Rhizobium sp. K1/93]QXZ93541.1 2-dehydropantoate 2-reductase [Rhizobium sp. K15/93]QYA04185.1 2-dehydropantoate 2-reductase [Rhizobium sp. B21/90]
MRILVVGAGSIGGYFGGRLLEAGRDVTFLVRQHRAEKLATQGLVVKSSVGDLSVSNPATVIAGNLKQHYDLVLLSCKAYDLEQAITDFSPAVGPSTRILPLLNGMRHMEMLDNRFGSGRVLGGLCMIATSLNSDGEIVHTGRLQSLTLGARDPQNEGFAGEVEKTFSGADFEVIRSNLIVQEMWEKWVFIATNAGLTTLMRAPIGDIVEAGGNDVAEALLDECNAISNACGYPVRPEVLKRFRKMFTAAGSPMTASLFRDLEGGGKIEADHIIGDMLGRASDVASASVLRIAFLHMRAYEARRRRLAESDGR